VAEVLHIPCAFVLATPEPGPRNTGELDGTIVSSGSPSAVPTSRTLRTAAPTRAAKQV